MAINISSGRSIPNINEVFAQRQRADEFNREMALRVQQQRQAAYEAEMRRRMQGAQMGLEQLNAMTNADQRAEALAAEREQRAAEFRMRQEAQRQLDQYRKGQEQIRREQMETNKKLAEERLRLQEEARESLDEYRDRRFKENEAKGVLNTETQQRKIADDYLSQVEKGFDADVRSVSNYDTTEISRQTQRDRLLEAGAEAREQAASIRLQHPEEAAWILQKWRQAAMRSRLIGKPTPEESTRVFKVPGSNQEFRSGPLGVYPMQQGISLGDALGPGPAGPQPATTSSAKLIQELNGLNNQRQRMGPGGVQLLDHIQRQWTNLNKIIGQEEPEDAEDAAEQLYQELVNAKPMIEGSIMPQGSKPGDVVPDQEGVIYATGPKGERMHAGFQDQQAAQRHLGKNTVTMPNGTIMGFDSKANKWASIYDPPPGNDPRMAQMELEAKREEMGLKREEMDMKLEGEKAKMQLTVQKAQMEMQLAKMKAQIDAQLQQQAAMQKQYEAMYGMQADALGQGIEQERQGEVHQQSLRQQSELHQQDIRDREQKRLHGANQAQAKDEVGQATAAAKGVKLPEGKRFQFAPGTTVDGPDGKKYMALGTFDEKGSQQLQEIQQPQQQPAQDSSWANPNLAGGGIAL